MPSAHTFAVFSAAAVFFALFPGPGVMYIVTRSVAQGRSAGVASALAMATGNLVHVLAATLGLSALLASSAAAFNMVKYLGSAYLVYLGIRALLDRRDSREQSPVLPERTLQRVYGEGVAVAILNPKTALFCLALLPQFVDRARGPVTLQILALGLLLVAITLFGDLIWGLLSSTAGNWLRRNFRFRRQQRFVTGGAYITLGIAAAFADARQPGK